MCTSVPSGRYSPTSSLWVAVVHSDLIRTSTMPQTQPTSNDPNFKRADWIIAAPLFGLLAAAAAAASSFGLSMEESPFPSTSSRMSLSFSRPVRDRGRASSLLSLHKAQAESATKCATSPSNTLSSNNRSPEATASIHCLNLSLDESVAINPRSAPTMVLNPDDELERLAFT